MKKLITLLAIFSTITAFATGKDRCDQLNRGLSGTQKVSLYFPADENKDEVRMEYLYSIKKVGTYKFRVTTKDFDGNILVEATDIILKVRANGRCYLYNPAIEDENNQMKVGPVYLSKLGFGRKIIEAEFSNAEGGYMVFKEI